MKHQAHAESLKSLVKEKYGQIADKSHNQNATSCCDAGDFSAENYTIMAESYTGLKGYVADADMGLGCGLPTEYAFIKEGDTVIDLGSGAGNDAFIARGIVGEKGKVIGIDFTEKMIEKARAIALKMDFNNIEFRLGDIESMPVDDNVADVVVSNCVLNLVTDKQKAFAEIFRVLRPGGHFSVSDIVLRGALPEGLRKSAEMYAGCVAGAIHKNEYISIIEQIGFTEIKIQKERMITIPDDIALTHLTPDEFIRFKSGESGIYSITVYAEKPALSPEEKLVQKAACCGVESNCC